MAVLRYWTVISGKKFRPSSRAGVNYTFMITITLPFWKRWSRFHTWKKISYRY